MHMHVAALNCIFLKSKLIGRRFACASRTSYVVPLIPPVMYLDVVYAVSGIVHLLGGGGKNVSTSASALAMFLVARKSCWNSSWVLRGGMCALE